MKKIILLLILSVRFSSIPLRIATVIKTEKIIVANKFKRNLNNKFAFIFEDPKDANEFYNYLNRKYKLNHQDVAFNVPFQLKNKGYYFSFSEVEIENKTFNVLPVVADAALESKNMSPMFQYNYIS